MNSFQEWLHPSLLVILVVLFTCSPLVLSDDVDKSNIDVLGGKDSLALPIPSWTFYMSYFNKSYSSLSQQLLRQKIFIAKTVEVFLTRFKYRLSQLSYYTSINEYSDSTSDEAKRMLSGDQSDGDITEEPPMDDEEAEQLLREVLNNNESNNNDDLKQVKDGQLLRKRRAVDDLKEIQWKIPSNNPDYEPIHVDVVEQKVDTVAEDIPVEGAKEIELEATQNQNKLMSLASQGLGRMKSFIGGAFDRLAFGRGRAPEVDPVTSDLEDAESREDEPVVIVDWLDSGCIGPVRNQGRCLSCYAMSAIGYMEWALCRNNNNHMTPLSVQYMISCGPQYKDETGGQVKLDGCSQGISRQTVDFIKEYGLELEDNMPYIQQDTQCPIKPFSARKKKGYIRPNTRPAIRLKPSTNQLDLALKTGPVIVGMREPKDFVAYGGGMVERCYPDGGHAMLIVGAMIENGEEYLLIKNSFGPSWGYDGYFKFRRSSIGECVKEFIVPRVSFPNKKTQARRVKAYLAARQTTGEEEPEDAHLDASILY